jgi:hypothetical protein
MARSVIQLGCLGKGRVCWLSGVKYKVTANLYPSCVCVKSLAKKEVEIKGEKFKVRDSRELLWSCGTEVEIEVRPKNRPAQEQESEVDRV